MSVAVLGPEGTFTEMAALQQFGSSVDYQDGIAKYLAGNHDAGIALIAKAADDGFYVSPPAVFQEKMYQEPEFVAILEKQKHRQARERKKVLDIVCNGNPYAEVWQPTEKTCEQHFSDSVD